MINAGGESPDFLQRRSVKSSPKYQKSKTAAKNNLNLEQYTGTYTNNHGDLK